MAGVLGGLTGCATRGPSALSPETVLLPATAGVIFDAELIARQDLSAYEHTINTGWSPILERRRAQVIVDPVHGMQRMAVQFTSDPSAGHGSNPNPRVQCETDYLVHSARHGEANDIYYVGFALYLPREFEDLEGNDWLTFAAGAYGAPYRGSGPLSLGIRPSSRSRGEQRLVLGDRPELLGDVTLPKGRWIDLVLGFRLAYADEGGWLSLYMNQGDGWAALAISGRTRAVYNTLAPGVNDAWHWDEDRPPNSSRINVYGNRPNTLVHGWHRIGYSFTDAMPNSYPLSRLPDPADDFVA